MPQPHNLPPSLTVAGTKFIRITRTDNGAVMYVHPSDINALVQAGDYETGGATVYLDETEYPLELQVDESMSALESAAGVKLTEAIGSETAVIPSNRLSDDEVTEMVVNSIIRHALKKGRTAPKD